jgi:hypothetical protein
VRLVNPVAVVLPVERNHDFQAVRWDPESVRLADTGTDHNLGLCSRAVVAVASADNRLLAAVQPLALQSLVLDLLAVRLLVHLDRYQDEAAE